MALDFGPYREQVRTLRMPPESAERIRQRLREESTQQTMAKAKRGPCVSLTPLISATAVKPAPQRKRHIALKAAACLAICLGVGALSIPVAQSLSDSPATAGAGIPSRPPQRIEFVRCGLVTPSDPSFDLNAPFNPSDSFGCILDVKLFLPAAKDNVLHVSAIGSDNIKLLSSGSAVSMEIVESDEAARPIIAQRLSDYSFSIAGTIPMDASKYDRCFRRGVSANQEWAQFIETLEDIRLVVEGESGTSTYRIDFSITPDQRAVELQMVSLAYRPVMLRLIQESE